jgi:hypothetical protein
MNTPDWNDWFYWFFLAGLAAAGTIVGSLGTWESDFQGVASEPGTDGAGLYTLLLGGASALALLTSSFGRRRVPCVVAMLFGLVILGIALYHLIDIDQQSGPLGTDPIKPGWGIWLTVMASGALALCCFPLTRSPERRSDAH